MGCKKIIDKRLAEKYKTVKVNKNYNSCFMLPDGRVIHIDVVGGSTNALVVEHGANLDEAKRNIMEDGDLFYPDEMSVDEMFEAMMKEIND